MTTRLGRTKESIFVPKLLVGMMTMFGCVGGSSDVLMAQERPAGIESAAPVTEPGERSPIVAALLQAALPPLPLGYIYAGDLGRALLPTGLMVGGSALFLVEVVDLVDWTDEDKSAALLYVGLASVTVGYVYGIVDAANAARDHNARLRGAVSLLRIAPSPLGTGVQVSVRLHSP